MAGLLTTAHLGSAAQAVEAALSQASSERLVSRLWAKDHTLWKPDPTEIANRLGWLTVTQPSALGAEGAIRELTDLRDEVRGEGYRDVVLLGMGGSSLGPEVLRLTFGSARGYPRLWVLDTTVPSAVRAATKAINPARTLFLVASKSGGTIEVMSLFAHFESLVQKAKGNRGGAQFIAITDPGTSLIDLAQQKGFRKVFHNPPDIGGRYSVLSYFGLVPAALIGVDVPRLLGRAEAMSAACRQEQPLTQNPGVYLGTIFGTLLRQGRDKVTVIASPGIGSFGLWAEQLLAESTGKEGTGLIPVAEEPLVAPSAYGDDRVFVYLRLRGDANAALDKQAKALVKAGHPLVELALQDRYDLGAEFFRWEFATAVAGHVIGIHPFDQPNVQESKNNTGRILKEVQATGRLPAVTTVNPRAALSRLMDQCEPGTYVGILAYMQPSRQADRALRRLRHLLVTRTHVATTAGYGPRYLHSTGQVHKGGPPKGLFLQLIETPKADIPIPGQSYTFGTLAQAQAIGDLQSLLSRQRPVIQVRLGARPLVTLRALGAPSSSRPRTPRRAIPRGVRKTVSGRRRPR